MFGNQIVDSKIGFAIAEDEDVLGECSLKTSYCNSMLIIYTSNFEKSESSLYELSNMNDSIEFLVQNIFISKFLFINSEQLNAILEQNFLFRFLHSFWKLRLRHANITFTCRDSREREYVKRMGKLPGIEYRVPAFWNRETHNRCQAKAFGYFLY